jgi:putative salt-induced outer membrane protein YdiY
MTGRIRYGIVLACLALVWSAPAMAAKTDLVVLNNGDRITGEVKGLDRGRLKYSTDSMGTIYIEWKDIDTLVSKEFHRVRVRDGRLYFGTLSNEGGANTLVVEGSRGTPAQAMDDIVRITPVEDSWKERIDLTVGAGFSYAKGSDVTTATAYADYAYTAETHIIAGTFRSDTTDDGDDTSTRNLLTGQYQHLLEKQRYRFLLGQAEQNNELDVDLRLVAGGGLGKYFIQNNRRNWLMAGGLGVAREENSDGTSDTDLEGIFQTRYDAFLYDTPKLDLTANVYVFPSITETGRIRSNYDITLSKEFIEDLFLDLTFAGSYDSRPASDNADEADYAITTGLSYEF